MAHGKRLQKRISPPTVTVLYIVWWWLSANRCIFCSNVIRCGGPRDQTLEQNVRPRENGRDDKHEDNAFDLAPILSTMQTGGKFSAAFRFGSSWNLLVRFVPLSEPKHRQNARYHPNPVIRTATSCKSKFTPSAGGCFLTSLLSAELMDDRD